MATLVPGRYYWRKRWRRTDAKGSSFSYQCFISNWILGSDIWKYRLSCSKRFRDIQLRGTRYGYLADSTRYLLSGRFDIFLHPFLPLFDQYRPSLGSLCKPIFIVKPINIRSSAAVVAFHWRALEPEPGFPLLIAYKLVFTANSSNIASSQKSENNSNGVGRTSSVSGNSA